MPSVRSIARAAAWAAAAGLAWVSWLSELNRFVDARVATAIAQQRLAEISLEQLQKAIQRGEVVVTADRFGGRVN
jgi:hypothetical protein